MPLSLKEQVLYFRQVNSSERRGVVSNFKRTNAVNEITVNTSAAIGNTSFRNSGTCPMNCHYPSTGFSVRQCSPVGHENYIMSKLLESIIAKRGDRYRRKKKRSKVAGII